MQVEKLTFKLGRPAHGWLPVSLAAVGFALDFTASAVPTDPLAELASALLLVTQQAEATVAWHLEPLTYQFQLSPEPDGRVRLTVSERQRGVTTRLLGSLSGSYEAVVLPIWRALQKLNPADFNGAAWPVLPLEKLRQLRKLVQARKATIKAAPPPGP